MMGFLSPMLLFLAAAAAVPLILHLFQRQQGPRVVFPALRYLRRAEKESARRIRLRQLLLLALRVAALALLALAAARPLLRSIGTGHEPTAVAIVLDNSLSSGLVVGDRRVLDLLKQRATETLEQAGPDDRFWLIRAGAPWEPAVPGGAAATLARVRETEVVAGAADLDAALARARALLAAGADGRATEIHLLSDLQATGFTATAAEDAQGPPVIVWQPRTETPRNRAVTGVEIGGGIPPRAGERSTVAARIAGPPPADTVAVRLAIENRISAADVTATGATAILPFPGRSTALVSGWVELDPDALRGDDRRYFVVHVQPPPTVAPTEPLPFVEEALDVLADAGRLRRVPAAEAEILLAPAGAGLEALREGRTVVVLAPAAPLEIPAVNRRLAAAGIPWRFAPPTAAGEARIAVGEENDALLDALGDVRIGRSYPIEPGAEVGTDSVLLRLRDGAPWVVRGERAGGGRYLLVASPLSTEEGGLATSPAMVPLLDRLIGAWAAAAPEGARAQPGEVFQLPPEATAVARPDGVTEPAPSGGEYRVPGAPGVYHVLAGDRPITAFAVNPPARESELERLDEAGLRDALAGWRLDVVRDAGDWADAVFRERLGREAWRPFLLLALAVLLLEGLVAAAGRTGGVGAGAGAKRPQPRTS
ncbi:MAG TPA: BatA domain-containing protein [Longimicrobiales bacterium]